MSSRGSVAGDLLGAFPQYGGGSQELLWERSGRLTMKLFSLFATLALWKINPRTRLNWYFTACAANGGKAPADAADYLPWNLSKDRLEELRSGERQRDFYYHPKTQGERYS